MGTTTRDDDRGDLHALIGGEHEVLTGSAEVTAAMRAAPRQGPRLCWAGGVDPKHVDVADDDDKEAATGDVLTAAPWLSEDRARAIVDDLAASSGHKRGHVALKGGA